MCFSFLWRSPVSNHVPCSINRSIRSCSATTLLAVIPHLDTDGGHFICPDECVMFGTPTYDLLCWKSDALGARIHGNAINEFIENNRCLYIDK